jgi:hypothetical protein
MTGKSGGEEWVVVARNGGEEWARRMVVKMEGWRKVVVENGGRHGSNDRGQVRRYDWRSV